MADRRSELESAIDADPDDLSNYQVLADHLIQETDPRGELIALQIEAERDPRLDRAAADLLAQSHLAPPTDGPSRLAWRAGYVRRAELVLGDVAAIDHPSCRFLRELSIRGKLWRVEGPAPIYRTDEAVQLIARRPRPTLRVLAIGTPDLAIGDVSRLLHAASGLTHLDLHGQISVLGGFDLPHLIELDLRFASMQTEVLAAIRQARWPALESLALRGPGHAANWDEVRPLFEHPPPQLTRLAITDNTITHPTLDALTRSPLLRQLRELALSKSITDGDLVRLDASAYRHLDLLDLSFNRLTATGIARARELAPVVVVNKQAS